MIYLVTVIDVIKTQNYRVFFKGEGRGLGGGGGGWERGKRVRGRGKGRGKGEEGWGERGGGKG